MTPLIVRFRYRISPRARFFAVSAGIHAVLAVGVIFFPILGPRGSTDDIPLVVDLVSAMPSAPAPARAERPPAKPEPKLQPAAPEPEPEGVRAQPEEVPAKPEPKPEKKEPEKTPRPPAPKPVATPSTEPASGTSAAPGIDTAGGTTALGLGDMEQAWYRDSVIAALQTHWVRPILEGSQETFEATVAFEILRDGSVRGARIEQASGIASLDRSALRAVADAAPFPPVPQSWREPVVPARIVFSLHPNAR